MESRKVVFVLNAVQQQRCIKRIEEFIDNGYEVIVYGYNRSKKQLTQPENFSINILGYIDNSWSYRRRLLYVFKTMKRVYRENPGRDVVFYYFLLDIAIVGQLLSIRPFMYENSDLMYAYMKLSFMRNLFKKIDILTVRRSILSVFTSEGFVRYLYGAKQPSNVFVVPNKLNKKVLSIKYQEKELSQDSITMGFVGFVRQSNLARFIELYLRCFPKYKFVIYGLIMDDQKEYYEQLAMKYDNLKLYGTFSNPSDLPMIYQNIDVVLTAFGDATNANVKYAEANKIYDSIYFNVPVIVGANTFMAEKVNELGIGFVINDYSEDGFFHFIKGITPSMILEKKKACRNIPSISAINDNKEMFVYLKRLDA